MGVLLTHGDSWALALEILVQGVQGGAQEPAF